MPYMLLVLFMPLLSLATAQAAETDNNPFLGLPHNELRPMLANLAPAADQRWYRMEVLIFARNDAHSNEAWRASEEPEPEADALPLLLTPADLASDPNENRVADAQAHQADSGPGALYQEAIAAGGWQLLAADERHFASNRERMLASGNYRILFHEAWHQPVFNAEESLPLLIEGGSTYQRPPLLTTPFPAEDAAPISLPDDNPVGMGDVLWMPQEYPELQGTLRFSVARFLHIEARLWLTSVTSEGTLFFAPLKQSRRMRSEETHYLDHPLFGVIVRIDPWDHPEQEKAALIQEALEQPEPAAPEATADDTVTTQ